VAALSDLLVPLARGPFPVVVTTLITAQFFFGLGLTIFGVGQVSLRQAITPDPLQGRMNATMNFIGASPVPLGELLGGILGEAIGLRTILFVAALGEALSVGRLLFSPLRVLPEQPAGAGEPSALRQGTMPPAPLKWFSSGKMDVRAVPELDKRLICVARECGIMGSSDIRPASN
jgi:hypothetical protein